MDVGCARIGSWDPSVVKRDADRLGRCDRARAYRYLMNGFWFIEFMKRGGRAVPMRRLVDTERGNARWDMKQRRMWGSSECTYRGCQFGAHSVINMGNEEHATQSLMYGCC